MKGKRRTKELEEYRYHLEGNLTTLHGELHDGTYRHGAYRFFSVNDPKRREIAVAGIKDRIVHRLLYEALVEVYDKTFIFDVWSCRKEKGLLGAIKKAQTLLRQNHHGWFWRADIQKFFDSVHQGVLLVLLERRVTDTRMMSLLREVIQSYTAASAHGEVKECLMEACGIPIGNITSQIFANIYLNELDRFVKHRLLVKSYLRYGDDFVLFGESRAEMETKRCEVQDFLSQKLRLWLHRRNDVIFPCKRGLRFLGCNVFSTHRRLKRQSWNRVLQRTDMHNASSYYGLVRAHSDQVSSEYFDWHVLGLQENLNA